MDNPKIKISNYQNKIIFVIIGSSLIFLISSLVYTEQFTKQPDLMTSFLSEEQLTKHTNIIVIMTDDLDVSTFDTLLELEWMPNLQRYILDKGTTFKNSFVTNSLCCPSRSTVLLSSV